MSKIQQKIISLFSCYLCDITIVAWIYFKASNYNRYTRLSSTALDSPDFQLQVYQILLRSLTFALLLFIVAQSVVYILAWKNFRSAYLYLKFFAVFGFAVSIFICFYSSTFAIPPMIIYVCGYYVFAKTFKELTAVMQSSHPQPIPQ